jgi:5'(3')-deoxyribonucleotidase
MPDLIRHPGLDMTTKKQIIAVDCDDVLVETAADIFAHYNRLHGTDISDYFEIWQAMSSDESQNGRNTYLDSQEYLNKQPVKDAMRVLTKLNESCELHIVTGRPSFMQDVTLAWLEKHLPQVFKTVIFTNYFSESGKVAKRSKPEVCRAIGADYLIDDHVHHAEAVAAAGIPVLLFGSYPWNADFNETALIHRVRDWQAVEEYFDGRG